MSTGILSTYIAAGYSLSSSVGTLDITSTGGIGGYGLKLGFRATIDNRGVIHADAAASSHNGVSAVAGASIRNEVGGTIAGYSGIFAQNFAATIANLGTIQGAGAFGDGVYIVAGGVVTNGSDGGPLATIYGAQSAVAAAASATITNFGFIRGGGGLSGADGVLLKAGGRVVNIGEIKGFTSGVAATGPAQVINTGYLYGYDASGLDLAAGGTVTNGSATNTYAGIHGYHGDGIDAVGASATVANFGGITSSHADGVNLAAGGRVTNGSASDAVALISGAAAGVLLGAGATLTNFGTVIGAGGYAVAFGAATDRVNAEAGSVFVGMVAAGSGVVDVVSGTATLGGGLSTAGTVEGLGTLKLTGGVSAVTTGARLLASEILEAGAGATVSIGAVLTDTKVFVQTAGTLSVLSGDRIAFDAVGDSFAGALTGAGTVEFTGGSDTLAGGAVLSAARMMIVNTPTVTLSGVMDLTTTLTAATPHLIVAAAGVTLSGGGTLALSNAASNQIAGASATATLTNLDRITGAGAIANLVLVNKAGALIDANQTTALILNTGTAKIANGGTLESTSTGGLTLDSAVVNTGALLVTKGTLRAGGAVSGTGSVRITGGVADFASTFSENVTFGATGVLELARSTTYAGTIAGFSKTGTTSLDLLDIGFVSGTTKASFSGTTTAGVLTITNGAHTARIHLAGNYTTSAWTVSSDGHGGTKVVDPTKAAGDASPHPLVAAMAGFGARAGGWTADAPPPGRLAELVVAPRHRM